MSRPRNSGPSIPCSARWRQTASLMATTCASVNEPSSEVPRWPDVPNATGARGGLRVGLEQRVDVHEIVRLGQLAGARVGCSRAGLYAVGYGARRAPRRPDPGGGRGARRSGPGGGRHALPVPRRRPLHHRPRARPPRPSRGLRRPAEHGPLRGADGGDARRRRRGARRAGADGRPDDARARRGRRRGRGGVPLLHRGHVGSRPRGPPDSTPRRSSHVGTLGARAGADGARRWRR